MCALLVRNCHTVATVDDDNTVLHGVSIRIADGKIIEIGPGLVAQEGERIIDAARHVVYPGFINTHHHLYQTMQRCIPHMANAKLFDWLTRLYQIWRHLTPEAVYVSALVGIGELLLSGCTTVADHFYLFPKDQPRDLLDQTISAAQQLGVRFHPTRGSMSRGQSSGGLPPDEVVQEMVEIIYDCERLIDIYHDPEPFSMLRIGLAPCSPFSVQKNEMKEIAAMAREKKNVRLHTHLAETLDENQFCLETYGKRPLALMEEVNWLGPDVWFAHGVHFNDDELKVLAETGTGIAHCPTSNLRLGSGIARIPEMTDLGIPVGLAVDGSASNDCSNMMLELRQTLLIHRVGTGVDRMSPKQALRLATRGGAKVLGRDDIGSLEVGKAADLALFSINDIGLAGALHDPVAAPFMSFSTGRTDYTIVQGEVVVEQGTLVGADVEEIIFDANKVADQMLQVASMRTGIDYHQD
jgi:cytosine/adenosine deaminase-related metal-dependent hydrolase